MLRKGSVRTMRVPEAEKSLYDEKKRLHERFVATIFPVDYNANEGGCISKIK